jgi:2-methylcitrate dehydratase PrpD
LALSATSDLLAFARAEHRLHERASSAAARLLADTLAVGAAGAMLSAPVEASASRWGAGNDTRLLGRGGAMPAPSAAFVNGFRIHCLEWDAVHAGAVVHALSVVTAALGAAIDRRGGCEPEEALCALAVGVDIAAGLGLASTGSMRFFRPATAGVIGAALAVARIEGADRFDDVLGLAYSQAAGTMQAHVEGSIALPLQIAGAARAAVTAVDLAAAGLTGPHDALEGPFGYFRNIEEGALSLYTDSIGSGWLIEQVSTKPYPSGRASHAVLATLDMLFREGETDRDDVVAVELQAPPLIRRLVDRPMNAGMTPSYARLCLPWLTALMLREGRIDPRRFTAEAFADAAFAERAASLSILPDGNDDPNALEPQRIVVRLRDGRRIERQVKDTLGSPDAPMSADQALAKQALAQELAGELPDRRLFDDPLAYFTVPR